jgi:hypothetical protein
MVSKINIKIEGLAQIEAAMKELGTQAANRIARSALDRAATPVVKLAREPPRRAKGAHQPDENFGLSVNCFTPGDPQALISLPCVHWGISA